MDVNRSTSWDRSKQHRELGNKQHPVYNDNGEVSDRAKTVEDETQEKQRGSELWITRPVLDVGFVQRAAGHEFVGACV